MTTYHIEYIVHLEIEAESEDEALKLGSQELHALDGDVNRAGRDRHPVECH